MKYLESLEQRTMCCSTADVHARDRNLLKTVARYEGEVLYPYPDSLGKVTIGVGFHLGDPKARQTLKRYAIPGVSYGRLMAEWDRIEAAWVESGHSLANLRTDKTNLKSWNAFVRQQKLSNANAATRTIDYEQSAALFRKSMSSVIETDLPAVFGNNFSTHPYDVQVSLADMTFNLGQNRVRGFKKMLIALENKQYGTASKEIKNSLYAKQVGKRATENAGRIGASATCFFGADSRKDWSGVQGQNDWYYGYNTGVDGDFVPFSTYDGNWHSMIGEGGYWTALWPTGGHPNGTNGNMGRVQALQHAVRRFVSPFAGRVKISGYYSFGDAEAHVLVDGVRYVASTEQNVTKEYSFELDVKVGAKIDFVIGPGTANIDVDDSSSLEGRIDPLDA